MDDGEDAHAVGGGEGGGETDGGGVQERGPGEGEGEGDMAMEDEREAGHGVRHCALCLEPLADTIPVKCGECQTRAYCSEECRKQDWTPGG